MIFGSQDLARSSASSAARAAPSESGSGVMPTGVASAGYLTLTYRESKIATDITFRVEAGDDMVSWSSAGLVETNRMNQGAYWEVTVRDVVPIASATNRFMRVHVSRP